MVLPHQSRNLSIRPGQAGTITSVGAAQTGGIDLTALMNLMLPMVIVMAMMGMMTRMMGSSTA